MKSLLKILLFQSANLLLWIIIFLRYVFNYISKDNFENLIFLCFSAFFLILSIISAILEIKQIKQIEINKSNKINMKIIVAKNDNDTFLNYIVTVIVPSLVFFNNLETWIAGLIYYFVILFVSCKAPILFCDPILLISGYNIYKCKVIRNQTIANVTPKSYELTLISKKIKENNVIKLYEFNEFYGIASSDKT